MARNLRSFLMTAVGLVFATSLVSCELNAQNSPDEISIDVLDNNVSGGGFQSDVTITDDGQTVYSSADVSGIFKSTDGGLRYENINEGLLSSQVASLAITPDNDNIIYVGTGDRGGSGGLFRSDDGGDTWVLTGEGERAQFAGNHSRDGDPVPDGHPRSNGDLIVVDQGPSPGQFRDDIVIAGTYNNGVHIFVNGGDRELSAVLTDGFVRSIAHDPSIPNTVFAAVQFSTRSRNGIYKIDYTRAFRPTVTLEYQTPLPEGLTVLSSGHVYGAIGDAGIVRFDGNVWSLRNGRSGEPLSVNDPNRQWTAVSGYVRSNATAEFDVVFAGTTNLGGRNGTENYSTVWRTVNGGNKWLPLVNVADDDTNNVSDQIYGQAHDWWFRTDAFREAGLGRRNSVVSSIDVSTGGNGFAVTDDIIYVSGRGGIWKSGNGGGSWQPAVSNMQATSNRGVAVNPNNPRQVVLANTDYVVLETDNRYEGSDVSRDRPDNSASRGYDVIFDTTADELILGNGSRDRNEGGEVYVKPASEVGTSSNWFNTDLALATSANGRVRAVAYGYHDGTSATSQTILAAVEGEEDAAESVYRYHNGAWTKSNGIEIGETERCNFVWPDNGNSGVVYLLDLSTGLYRSNDGGRNWTDIWPDMSFNNNDFFNTGYITADDNDPTTLYVSVQTDSAAAIGSQFRVYRLTGADTGRFGIPGTAGATDITDITFHSGGEQIRRPGPIVFGADGNLWLTQQQNSRNLFDAALYVMENPATNTSFTDVTTNEYRNIAIAPSGIDVASDGHVYISQNGVGVVKLAVTYPGSEFLLGDVNRDGVLSTDDIMPFWDIVLRGAEYRIEADFNEDGEVDFGDVPLWRMLRATF